MKGAKRDAVVMRGNLMTSSGKTERLYDHNARYRARKAGVGTYVCVCGRTFPDIEKPKAHRLPRPNNFMNCPGRVS